MSTSQSVANSNKFNYIKDIKSFYGKMNGFLFYSEETTQVGLIRVYFRIKDTEENREVAKSHFDSFRAIGPYAYRFEREFLLIELKINGLDDEKELTELFYSFTASLDQKENNDSLGIYRLGTKLSFETNETFQEQAKDMSKVYRKQNDNPMLAYIMAIFGLLPGIIIYVILSRTFFSFIGAYVMFQMSIKMFKKYSSISKNDSYVLLAMTFFGIFISQYLYMVSGSFGIISGIFNIGAIFKLMASTPMLFNILKNSVWHFGIILIMSFNQIKGMMDVREGPKMTKRKTQRLL